MHGRNYKFQGLQAELLASANQPLFACLVYKCLSLFVPLLYLRILFRGFVLELSITWLSCCNGFQVSDTHSCCSRMFNVMKRIEISQVVMQRGAVHKCSGCV